MEDLDSMKTDRGQIQSGRVFTRLWTWGEMALLVREDIFEVLDMVIIDSFRLGRTVSKF